MNFGLIVFLFLEDFLPPESLFWAALSAFHTGWTDGRSAFSNNHLSVLLFQPFPTCFFL